MNEYLKKLYDVVGTNKYRMWAGHSVHMDATPTSGVYFVVGQKCKTIPVPFTRREVGIVKAITAGWTEHDTIDMLMADCLKLIADKTETPSSKDQYNAFVGIVDDFAVNILKKVRPYNRMAGRRTKEQLRKAAI